MKTKNLITVFTFLFVSNLSFASFPVNQSDIPTSKEKTEVLIENSEITSDFNSEPTNIIVDKTRLFKILSMSFSGVSIVFSILSIATEIYGFLILGILFLIPAIVFMILYYANK